MESYIPRWSMDRYRPYRLSGVLHDNREEHEIMDSDEEECKDIIVQLGDTYKNQ